VGPNSLHARTLGESRHEPTFEKGNTLGVADTPPAVTPTRETEPALAAPGLERLLSTPATLLPGSRLKRRQRSRPYRHVHLEVDLAASMPDATAIPAMERLAALVKEQKVVERGTLLALSVATLHAMSARGFRRVDHWEIDPGGWIAPPRARGGSDTLEPVGELLDALESGIGSSIGLARSFSARLSDTAGNRADVTVRRVHRARRHSLMVDLWGTWTKPMVRDLEASLAQRLPVVRTSTTRFEYV
jgi:hypothetical protein